MPDEKPIGPGALDGERRESYNYWIAADDHPMAKAHRERYALACKPVSGFVLDLACGWGTGTAMLAVKEGVSRVLGVDRDPEAVNYGRERVPENVELLCADLDEYRPPECDWLVTMETIEHLKDMGAFIRRCKQAARKGIVFSAPVNILTMARNEFHRHEVTDVQVADWFGGMKLELAQELLTDVPETAIRKKVGKFYVFRNM